METIILKNKSEWEHFWMNILIVDKKIWYKVKENPINKSQSKDYQNYQAFFKLNELYSWNYYI